VFFIGAVVVSRQRLGRGSGAPGAVPAREPVTPADAPDTGTG
jgi:hypothetical protein